MVTPRGFSIAPSIRSDAPIEVRSFILNDGNLARHSE
jgi:hypothetical protein